MSTYTVYGLLLFALMLSSCATVEPDNAIPDTPAIPTAPSEPPIAVKDVRQTIGESEQLLSYFERIKRLPSGELAKELESVRIAYGRISSDFNRISYAMLLALPGTSFMDDGRALELLDPLVKRGEASLRGLAFLLVNFIQERRRIAGDLNAAQQKLDALRSLERNLIERDQNNQGRK